MAELAASAFAAVSGMFATAAPTAAATTAATTSAMLAAETAALSTSSLAAASSATLSTLQSGLTIASMVSTAISGIAGYQRHQSQAKFAEIEALNERTEAMAQSNRITRDLMKKIGDNRVALAGAGIDISSGADAEATLAAQAGLERDIALSGGDMRAAGRQGQAAAQRNQSYASLVTAAGRAAERGFDTYTKRVRRGGPDYGDE